MKVSKSKHVSCSCSTSSACRYSAQSPEQRAKALFVSWEKSRPSFFIESSHTVSTMRILSDPMERIRSSVPSSDRPTLTTNSSTIGNADRMASTTG